MKKAVCYCMIMVVAIYLLHNPVFGDSHTPQDLFDKANNDYLRKGKYSQAIVEYDKLISGYPDLNVTPVTLMKGIALNNMGEHESSLRQFYLTYLDNQNNIVALAGLGIGFGYLGEYHEANKYFEHALQIKPENQVIKNYHNQINKILTKYPYSVTEKPEELSSRFEFPAWVKQTSLWWSENKINDKEYFNMLGYLFEYKIIEIQDGTFFTVKDRPAEIQLKRIKQDAMGWYNGTLTEGEFSKSVESLIVNRMVHLTQDMIEELNENKKRHVEVFERYVDKISKKMHTEKRYIEFPNPSNEVIKKYLRDYVKWNFEQEAKAASDHFPDPEYKVIDGIGVTKYRIFVNEQPSELPLDHVSTLQESIHFWESQKFLSNNKTAKIDFVMTEKKHEANIWVTWVIRDLGEGVLGHAHLGKGVVEVSIGDYNCDGKFQLYDVDSVEKIMRHELGHSIGLQYTSNPDSIMYPSLEPDYAYCLLELF